MNRGNLARAYVLLFVIALLLTACAKKAGQSLNPASIVDISGDSLRAFVITDKGDLWATGLNDWGQLGIGQEDRRLVEAEQVDPRGDRHFRYLPTPIKVAGDVKQAVISTYAGAYLTTSGELWVMGEEQGVRYFAAAQQELANLAFSNKDKTIRPLKVMEGVKKIVADRHFLILKENGDLYGVGENLWGELGTSALSAEPVLMDQDVVDVFIGSYNTFYLKSDGKLYGCGRNFWGELGFGEPTLKEYSPYSHENPPHSARMNFIPQPIASDIQSVYSKDYSTLLLKTNGELYLLGRNIEDVYPNGAEYSTVPQLIAENVRKMGVAHLDAGKAIIILNEDDKLLGWGSGLASLGADAGSGQWIEIMSGVKDFWTTPNLFVLSKDGSIRAAGRAAEPYEAEIIKESDIGQLAGWSWD